MPTLALFADRTLPIAAFDYFRPGLDTIPVVDNQNHLIEMFALIEAAKLLLE